MMKIKLIAIGSLKDNPYRRLVEDFSKRLMRYCAFEEIELDLRRQHKSLPPKKKKALEFEAVKSRCPSGSHIILLDETGHKYSSRAFANKLNSWLVAGPKHLIFVLGGAYGFDARMYALARYKLSLSEMTFNHQLARVMFVEQLYRAFSILHNEPYHND